MINRMFSFALLPTNRSFPDIDAQSLVYARANVARNGLEGRIAIVTADPEGSIFGPIETEKETL